MKNNQSLVSVIIPTYNRGHLIGETLDSVLAQTYQNWECIIVDDGSSDNTDEVVSEYVKKDSRFKYFHRPEEHLPGGNGARNYGFKLSQGEYVNWFDSDDLMDNGLLIKQIKNIDSNTAVMSICLYNRYDESLSKIMVSSDKFEIKNSLYYDYILKLINFNLQTILFKKHFIKNYKLKENLYKSQELEFLQRILRNVNTDFVLLNQSLVKIRRHNNSITGLLNDKRLKSMLEVSSIIMKELPKQSPIEIKKKLFLLHTQNLKVAYLNKKTVLFLFFLFKPFREFVHYKFLLSLLYFIFYITDKGQMTYKRVQKHILK